MLAVFKMRVKGLFTVLMTPLFSAADTILYFCLSFFAQKKRVFNYGLSLSLCMLTALLFSIKANGMALLFFSFVLNLFLCFLATTFLLKRYAQMDRLLRRAQSGIRTAPVLAFGYFCVSFLFSLLIMKNSVFLNARVADELAQVYARLPGPLSGLMGQKGLAFAAAVFCTLVALPGILFLVGLLFMVCVPRIVHFFRALDQQERLILLSFIALIAVLTAVNAVFNPLFFLNITEQSPVYRGIFGADSDYIVYYDLAASPVLDDIRHPLYGIVTMPFSAIVWVLAWVVRLGSLFRVDLRLAYGVGFALAQAFAVGVSAILLKKLVEEQIGRVFAMVVTVLFLCSFPSLFFAMIVERYAVSLLYLLIFVYLARKKGAITPTLIAFVCAVGALATSAMLLPLLFLQEPRRRFVKIFKRLFVFCAFVLIVTGRFQMLIMSFHQSDQFINSYSTVLGVDNVRQYSVFLRSLLLCPSWILSQGSITLQSSGDLSSVSVVSSFLLLGVAAVSFVAGRKYYIMRVSFFWLLFSVGLLLFAGVGTVYNEMALYSLYFNWGFIVLLSYGFFRVLTCLKKTAITAAFCAAAGFFVLAYNLTVWASMVF